MTAVSDLARMLYESRARLRRNETGNITQALREAVEEMATKRRIRAEMNGSLRAYQRLLELPLSTDDELDAIGDAELAQLIEELFQRLVQSRS